MPRGKDQPTATRALRREATRAALVAAAHALAGRPGADPLDPAAVAAEAGVSRPLFYAHFPTRADFADALLAAIHESAAAPPAVARGADPHRAVLDFFHRLAAPLDRHAGLARVLIPASHLAGPVAEARARRRAAAIAHLATLLPSSLADRGPRAAFLMDAFLGVQLAWAKAAAGSLARRVRRELGWAVTGVLARPPASPSLDPHPPEIA